MPKKHAIRRAVALALDEVWAMLPSKLDQVATFLEIKAANMAVDLERARAEWTTSQSQLRALVGRGDDDDDDGPLVVDGVGLLSLVGTLGPRMNLIMDFSGGTSTQQFGQAFDALVADPQVETILIEADSPGGVVTYTAELAAKMYAARKRKRVVTVATGMMASACYWIGSTATEVVASPTAEIGSIGVYSVVSESSKRNAEMGVTYNVIRAGDLKASGNPYEPLTAERRASLQARVDAPYAMFLAAVAQHRGVSVQRVESDFGQGAVFMAEEARRRGLVDRVATLEEVLAEERRRTKKTVAGFGPPAEAREPDNLTTSAGTGTVAGHKVGPMNKIKAALYALGLLNSTEASEETVNAALAGFFRGQVPAAEADVLKGLAQGLAGGQPAAGSADNGGTAGGGSAAANVTAAHEREVAEARAAERARIADLRGRAELLRNTGFAVAEEDLTAAINNNETVAQAVDRWTSRGGQRQPEATVGRVERTESELEKVHAAAIEVMTARWRPDTRAAERAERRPLSPIAASFRNARLIDMARADLRARNVSVSPMASDEEVATHWLAIGGRDTGFLPSADAGQTAASFPNLLSGLVGKMLDQAIELSDTTYKVWTGRLADIPDLKPKLIVAAGGLDRLDQLSDSEKAPEVVLTEETPGWIQIGRYGNKVGLTPVMVANDDLDAFMTTLQDLGVAHDRTLNTLCISLLVGNVTLLDGFALFDDTNHKNDITAGGGGVPSTTQAAKHKLKHRTQTGIGGVGKVRTPPAIALVPAALEENADQTFLPLAALMNGETKVAATDGNLNTHRGKIIPVVEPELDDFSAAVWYTFANPARRRVIVHAFQRGYGEGGQRTTWTDPDSGTRWYKVEGRMAAAVAGFRGGVRNAGS